MDDIKLCARNERDINSLIHLTRLYSNDIGMSFGPDKCGQMISKRGKVTSTEGIKLPEGNIADVQGSYKYLRVQPVSGSHEEATRRSATVKYL